MRLLNVLTCSVEFCFLVGRRKYTVGASAAIVASMPVVKRSSEELNLRFDMIPFVIYVLMLYEKVFVLIELDWMFRDRDTTLAASHVYVNSLSAVTRSSNGIPCNRFSALRINSLGQLGHVSLSCPSKAMLCSYSLPR